jgi:hypothetical protein
LDIKRGQLQIETEDSEDLETEDKVTEIDLTK